jgi:hypothetical protein
MKQFRGGVKTAIFIGRGSQKHATWSLRGRLLRTKQSFLQGEKRGQLYAAPPLTLWSFPPSPVSIISLPSAPGISLAVPLRFLSYSPATGREHYATVKVLRSLLRACEGWASDVAERREDATRYGIDYVSCPGGDTQA